MNKQETIIQAAEKYVNNEIGDRGDDNDVLMCYLDFIAGANWQQEQDNKVPKILESLLEENYDLNIQFHKFMRESIFCFAVAMYDEKLPFKEWEKKYYGNYIEQPKHQQERMYSEEEVEMIARDAYEMGRKNILIGVFNKWFKQFSKLKNG